MVGERGRNHCNPLTFRIADREDDDDILALFQEAFQRNASREWHEWFCYQCPTGNNRYYLATDAETSQLVGFIGYLMSGDENKESK